LEVLADPSPKLQAQELGVPVDVSVNCTDCPAVGRTGVYVNDEARTDVEATVTVLLTCFDIELFFAMRLTV
jgi:hypothetical protein